MAFFRGIGNALGTAAGAVAAPFDGGELMRDQAKKTKEEFETVGETLAQNLTSRVRIHNDLEDRGYKFAMVKLTANDTGLMVGGAAITVCSMGAAGPAVSAGIIGAGVAAAIGAALG